MRKCARFGVFFSGTVFYPDINSDFSGIRVIGILNVSDKTRFCAEARANSGDKVLGTIWPARENLSSEAIWINLEPFLLFSSYLIG